MTNEPPHIAVTICVICCMIVNTVLCLNHNKADTMCRPGVNSDLFVVWPGLVQLTWLGYKQGIGRDNEL